MNIPLYPASALRTKSEEDLTNMPGRDDGPQPARGAAMRGVLTAVALALTLLGGIVPAQAEEEDTTAPTLVAGTLRISTITLHFSETLDTQWTLRTDAFRLHNASGLGSITGMAYGGDNTVTLTISGSAINTHVVLITVNGSTVADPAGNWIEKVTRFRLTNTLADNPGAPVLSTAEVDGDTLTLTYDKKMLPKRPPNAAFTVSGTATATTVTDVVVTNDHDASTSTVVLTLSKAVTGADTVTLSYNTADHSPRFQSEWGTHVAALTDQAVTNNMPPVASITGGDAVTEGGDVEFTVTVTPTPTESVTVNLTITETGGGGYVASTDLGAKTVIMEATDMGSVTYTVDTNENSTDGPDGTVTATLTADTGSDTSYTVSTTNNTASVTVNDDDDPVIPVASITGGSAVTEGGEATFTVTLTPVPTASVDVNLTITDTGDYLVNGEGGAKTVSMTTGTATYTVRTDDDSTDEANGAVIATLTEYTGTGTGYTVASAPGNTASVTVNDNDATPPEARITGGNAVTEGTPAEFTVTLTPAPTENVTVNLTITQTGGGYVASGALGAQRVTVGTAGTATYTVPTVGDSTAETNGAVIATLTEYTGTGTGYTVASAPNNAASVTVISTPESVPLVSNTGQASAGEVGFSYDYSQQFFTREDATTLAHVDLEMRSTASTSPTYTVSIWSNRSARPLTRLATLTKTNPTRLPASFGTVRFTAPAGIDLRTHSSYHIVVDVSAGDDTTAWRTTDVGAEDAGPTTDWRLHDNLWWRNQDNSGEWWAAGNRVAKIAIHGFVRDMTAPTLRGGTINSTTVKLYFSENLDTTQTLDESAFTVTGGSTTLGDVSNPKIDTTEPNIVTLTLATGANNSETAAIAITASAGIRDTAGNALAAVTNFALTNIGAAPPAAPTLSSAVVLHDTLTLTYNQRLLPRFTPPSAFTVSVPGKTTTVTGLALTPGPSSSTVVLTLSPPVQRTDRVQLSYSPASEPPLQNEWGDPAGQLFDHRVTSRSCATTDIAVSAVVNGGDTLAEECTVLLWLRDALVGTGLAMNWETGTTMDDWHGITVAGNPARVTRLSLAGWRLSGSLTSLNALTSLTWLNFTQNYLTGTIPDLSKLTNLTHLSLSRNYLTGPIPDLSDLTNLTYLGLEENRLTGPIPRSLSRLTKLDTLDLENNHLSGPIPSLAGLTKLRNVYLHDNHLSGNIPDLSTLAILKSLKLSNNRLTGNIPSSLSSRTTLQFLYLNNNQLTGPFPDLRSLPILKRLELSHNDFTAGDIPDWVTTLAGLTHIDLSHTNRTGTIPAALGALTNLQRLRLHTNPLSGSLPTTWGGASHPLNDLRLLDLRHTAVQSDPLPTGLRGRAGLAVWRSVPSVTLPTGHAVTSFTTQPVPQGTSTPLPPVYRASAPPGTSFPAAAVVYEITVFDSSGNPITTALETPLEVCLPLPAALPASRAYVHRYQPHATDPEHQPGRWGRQTTGRRTETEDYTISPDGLDQIQEREGRVCATVSQFSHFRVSRYASSGGGGGSGRGGGGDSDRPGNSAATATPIAFPPASPRAGSLAGQINTRSDVDYFRLRLAQAGVLLIETNGSTDTRGTVWQAGEELAAATDGGPGANFRLATPVEAGDVLIAIAGEGGATGGYTLRARLVVGHVENPSPTSFQSGLGLISGWVCEAEGVTVEIEKADGEVVELAAAYGTARADTAGVCGDTDNGFGVLVNWNLLDDGDHAVRVLINGVALGTRVVPGVGPVPALVDGIELGRAPVTVTTLGAEFVKGLTGSVLVEDFPGAGEQVHLVWQESQQNFVLAPAELGATGAPAPSSGAIEGVLENPAPASFQSGIGVISGWVCEADEVLIEIDGQPIAAAGTERVDTLDRCGDVDNGFGLLVNWAEFGAGAHEVVALVDGAELSRATVTVTLVDATEPFVRGLTKRVELPDFPTPDETVTLEWQESQQNFVITGVD